MGYAVSKKSLLWAFALVFALAVSCAWCAQPALADDGGLVAQDAADEASPNDGAVSAGSQVGNATLMAVQDDSGSNGKDDVPAGNSGSNANVGDGGAKGNVDAGNNEESGTKDSTDKEEPETGGKDAGKTGETTNPTDGTTKDDVKDDTKDDPAKDDANKETEPSKDGDAKDGDAKGDAETSEDGVKTDDPNADGSSAKDAETVEEIAPVAMLRLYNPYTGEHFYTASESERDALVAQGWIAEGESWQSPEKSDVPVYRLYNPYAGDHHYTTSSEERDSLVSTGWTSEDVAWYSAAEDAGQPVYRLYNPFAVTGAHHYTLSVPERTDLVSRGWLFEGVAWYALAAEQSAGEAAGEAIDLSTVTYQPVYRMYFPINDDHLYTSSKDERNSLASWIWHYEGASFQTPSAGDHVYRLSNPGTGEHMYTTNADESGSLVRAGWTYEGVWFNSCVEADEARIPVFRLYNPATALHHYTVSEGERDSLMGAGWQSEGTAFYVHALDEGFVDDMETWTPRLSGDAAFDMEIEKLVYVYSDLESAYNYVVGHAYRSGNRFWSGPHVLDDATTMDYAREMFEYHSGNCYRFASLFSWMARGLGYSTNVISGWVPSASSGAAPHGWVEIYIDGQTYICDPDLQHEIGGAWYMRTYDNPPTTYGSW